MLIQCKHVIIQMFVGQEIFNVTSNCNKVCMEDLEEYKLPENKSFFNLQE